eukprot:124337_1
MTNNASILVAILLCATLPLVNAQSREIHVSKKGSDHSSCGDATDPCGTLYKASLEINATDILYYMWTVGAIFVDGQNETDINQYISSDNTNNYDPCLPIPFDPTRHIFIMFNSTLIQDTIDWYPYHLCNKKRYKNDFLFAGGRYMSLSNLVIKNYAITNKNGSYPLIRSGLTPIAEVMCDTCTFQNITSSITEKPLIYTAGRIQFSNTQCIDIYAESRFIYAHHGDDLTMAPRSIVIKESSFDNVYAVKPFIYFWPSNNDVNYLPSLEISDSNFNNIHTETQFIDDATKSCAVNIINTNINVASGSFYYSGHISSSTIVIDNVNISTGALSTEDDTALFTFSLFDHTNVSSTQILYLYNTSESCSLQPAMRTNTLIGYDCAEFICVSPIKAIENEGQIHMSDITFDMEIASGHDTTECNVFEWGRTINLNAEYVISNYGIMYMTNIMIKRSVGLVLVANEYQLFITDLSFDESAMEDYNPNLLEMYNLIDHQGPHSSTVIQSSNLMGAFTLLSAEAGAVEIVDTTLQMATYALIINNIDEIVIRNCVIQNVGAYYGRFLDESFARHYNRGDRLLHRTTTPIQIMSSNQVSFYDNKISTYDPDGLLLFISNAQVSLVRNTFEINSSFLYYNVTQSFLDSPLQFSNTEDTTLIQNYFEENTIDEWPRAPLIHYHNPPYTASSGVNCLSGNTFVGPAIWTEHTNLTSCFRPELVHHTSINSTNQLGSLQTNMELFNQKGVFLTDIPQWDGNVYVRVILANMSHVAMDNVNFTTMSDTLPFVMGYNSRFMFIDSYASEENGHDISVSTFCNVTSNDRLHSDIGYISNLLFKCGDDDGQYKISTTQSRLVRTVDHLAAVQINITAEGTTYYPGQSLTFDYEIMDRFDNDIPVYSSGLISILLTGQFFSTNLYIDQNGDCVDCDNGIVINTLSLESNYNETFIMDISVDDVLYATNAQLTLDVIGCPLGYGPDSHDITCIECAEGYFNQLTNNIDPCRSCGDQQGIECIDGTVYVTHNYWMDITDDHEIVSASCPVDYCCENTDMCDYIHGDEELLCALNRDRTSPLCGKCKEGYSESMNSTKCVRCKSSFYFGYVLLPFLLSIVFALVLMATNTDKINKDAPKKEQPSRLKQVLQSEYCKMMLKIMFFKCTVYYEQGITQILAANGTTIGFHSFAALFHLSVFTNSNVDNEDNLWCFVDGLDAKGKILIDLLVPAMIGVWIASTYLYYKFKVKTALIVKGRQVNFGKTAIATIVMMIGKILDVLFRLLACTKIADQSVHSYFGYEKCGGNTQIFAALSLVLVIVGFGMLFLRLRRMDVAQRQNPKYFASVITSKYKPQYYDWEFTLFIRRIFIAFYAVYIEDITYKFMFIIIFAEFAYIQHKCNPFIIHQANQMEFFLLMCFVIIAMSQLVPAIDAFVLNALISIMIILPGISCVHYVYELTKIKPRDAEKLEEYIASAVQKETAAGTDERKTDHDDTVDIGAIDAPSDAKVEANSTKEMNITSVEMRTIKSENSIDSVLENAIVVP